MFKIFHENKSISWILTQKDYIDFSPSYQRMGNVWSKGQKQLLIDSIINGFDIPKLYFHFMPQNNLKPIYNYGVIDGKQRLEAILDFVQDKFPLSTDFRYLCNDTANYCLDVAGKYFSEIDSIEPSIIAKLFQYELCIVFMDTDDPDIINETFIRLNSGISVNTAEKRNAIGGNLSKEMKKLYTESSFFTEIIAISNTRYAHFDLALKLLMTEMGCDDLGKKSVDEFVKLQKDFDYNCQQALKRVISKLNRLSKSFSRKDKLLSKKNLIITLFSILDEIPEGHLKPFMSYFEKLRSECMSKEDKSDADALMVEFTLQLQQGADKKASLEKRITIMEKYLHIYLVSALGYA